MSNGSEVLVFAFSTLPQRGCFLAAAATPNKHGCYVVFMLYAAVLYPAVLFGVNNKQIFD